MIEDVIAILHPGHVTSEAWAIKEDGFHLLVLLMCLLHQRKHVGDDDFHLVLLLCLLHQREQNLVDEQGKCVL